MAIHGEGLVKKRLMEDGFSCTWEGTEPYTTRGQQSPGEGFENDFLTVPSEQVPCVTLSRNGKSPSEN